MPRRWRVDVSGAARRDLENIVAWTREEFGSKRALAYVTSINAAMERLEEGPFALGTVDRPEIGPAIRTLHIARISGRGRHLLMFAQSEHGTIEILRILHDAMDLPRHGPSSGLSEDPGPFAP
jgi:toxin ParE1/3/4